MSNNNIPTISVVIPLYNKEPYIGRALNSVLKQTVQDFEIIVVNDGSSDEGAKIVENIQDTRIRLIHQINQGVSAARNRGIENSKAELISFLDADDAYKPKFLETVLMLKSKYPQAGAFAMSYEIVDEKDDVFVSKLRAVPAGFEEGIIPDYFKAEKGNSPVFTSAVAIPKKVFQEIGGFPEGIRKGEDIEKWARIALIYPIAFSNKIGAVYYNNATNRISHNNDLFDCMRMVKMIDEAIRSNKKVFYDKSNLIKFRDLLLITSASALIINGEREKGRSYLMMSSFKGLIGLKIWWYLWSLVPDSIIKRTRKFKKKFKN